MKIDKSLITLGTQTAIALAVTGAFIYSLLANTAVPEHLFSVWGLIVGYYFAKNGSKINSSARQ